ncbi:hypothetical protein AAEO56_11570 [Flavobacterium sp. DGU11]|uniref:Uncharacterized protein n=1 Tax=Flavobacterium arundinis TaxID=3139143 RepID=A0ABU9HXP1_9FLAO
METNFLIYIVASVLITSLLWFIYIQKIKTRYAVLQNNHEYLNNNLDKEVIAKADQNVVNLQNIISDLKSEVAEVRHQSYRKGYADAQSEFSIQVFPYREEYFEGNDGLFINDIKHEIVLGYQYQLFVKGIPVLQPAIIIEETLYEEKREIDLQKINNVVNLIESKLKAITIESNGLMKFISKVR